MKTFQKKQIYNFAVEFNRIEKYNEYVMNWLNYFEFGIDEITNKTNWSINDIPDLKDFNRIKSNINQLLFEMNRDIVLPISNEANQEFTVEIAQEIENALNDALTIIGNWEFAYSLCGLATCGSTNLLVGV